MKFTRSQFAKTFGVSMESLHYLEKNGILQIARNEDNQYMEYTEDQIPIVLSIKKFQQAGIPLEEILPGSPVRRCRIMPRFLSAASRGWHGRRNRSKHHWVICGLSSRCTARRSNRLTGCG